MDDEEERFSLTATCRKSLKLSANAIHVEKLKVLAHKCNKDTGKLRSYVVKISLNSLPCVVKACDASVKSYRNSLWVEITALKFVRQLVIKRISPHVVLPIGMTITKSKLPKFFKSPVCKKVIDTNQPHCMILTELTNYGDLGQLIEKRDEFNVRILKQLLFQVIYTLHCLQVVYKGHRHNDLHCGNVLIEKLETPINVEYSVHGQKFVLNGCSYQARLHDYSFAVFPENVITSNDKDDQGNDVGGYFPSRTKEPDLYEPNSYIDLNKLFNHLTYTLKTNHVRVDTDTLNFIRTVLPKHLRVGYNLKKRHLFSIYQRGSYQCVNNPTKTIPEYITPQQLLQHSYFDEFNKSEPETIHARYKI